MVNACHGDVVGHQFSVFFYSFFWHRKQRDPFDSRRGPFDLCEHQVHYIFHSIVFACGYEDLLTPDLVIAVIRWLCGGGDVSKGTSSLRFGQCHGPLPLPSKHPRNIGIDEFLCPKGGNEVSSPVGE